MKLANTNERFVNVMKDDPQGAMKAFCKTKTKFKYADYAFCNDVREDSIIFSNDWKKIYADVKNIATENGVCLLAENSCTANMDCNTYFMTGKELKDFSGYVASPFLKAVWDVGHANIEKVSQYDEIVALGDALKAVHIHDNFGMADDHLPPFTGTVNFDEIICALSDVGFEGYFTFETSRFLLDGGMRPHKRKEFLRSERLINPPMALNIEAANFLYETGKEMLSAYVMYEE